jgi:uroporphyrinogen decarboxylase
MRAAGGAEVLIPIGSDRMLEKENLLRAITRDDPDHVPIRRLDGSIAGMVRIIYRDSRALLSGTDRWGVTWAGGSAATSEWDAEIQGYPVNHPLRDLAGLEAYPFPDPDEPGIIEGLMEGIDREQVLVTGEICFPVQDRAHLLMGLEGFCLAAVDQPERVQALLRRIADYQIGIVRRYLALGADIIRGLDDYGGQQALLLGPRLWRRLIKPELARIIRAAKEGGAFFWLHSCGHVMEIIPDLIEIGVDILDPVQVRANDQAAAKRLYGDKICFMGGIDTQHLLTEGTPEEIVAAVRERIRMLAPGGGYILAPDTLIPVPAANYRAYLEAGAWYGKYPVET